jgi:hypothetical protein
VRRQTDSQGASTRWVVQPLDIDPFYLPVRYNLFRCGLAGDVFAAQEQVIVGARSIALQSQYLGHDLNLRRFNLSDFKGVAIRISPFDGVEGEFVISVNLHHHSAALCIPLHVSFALDDVNARWQSWARVLRLPLLLPSLDGGWSEPIDKLGKLSVRPAITRKPKHLLDARRPKIKRFREVGCSEGLKIVNGTEIIARS